MSSEDRAHLPGVSETRALQLLAGALVAEAAMELFEVEELEICPWALREGLILRRLDQLVFDGPLAPPDHIRPIESERRRSAMQHPAWSAR
jgi:exopolyphosphatase/guanosine-5'-triphosphate,3'-diphosphate pyrophosphatase